MKQLNTKESFAYEYGRLPDEFPREYWNYYKQGFKRGEENCHLLYTDLMEAAGKFTGGLWMSDAIKFGEEIHKILDKIKSYRLD